MKEVWPDDATPLIQDKPLHIVDVGDILNRLDGSVSSYRLDTPGSYLAGDEGEYHFVISADGDLIYLRVPTTLPDGRKLHSELRLWAPEVNPPGGWGAYQPPADAVVH